MKNLRAFFFLSFIFFLVSSISRASTYDEKLRKEIIDITKKQKELIYEAKKEILVRDILMKDIDKAIRKIDSHEITCWKNDELENIYERDKDLNKKSEDRKKRNNNLLKKKAFIEGKLKENPKLKSYLSNSMDDLNEAINEWNVFFKEKENPKILLYNKKRKAILEKVKLLYLRR